MTIPVGAYYFNFTHPHVIEVGRLAKKKSFTLNINATEGKLQHFCSPHGGGSAVYGLGFLGALVYFLSRATDFWTGLLGIVKAIFWPAFLVHGLLKFLGL